MDVGKERELGAEALCQDGWKMHLFTTQSTPTPNPAEQLHFTDLNAYSSYTPTCSGQECRRHVRYYSSKKKLRHA